MRSRAQAERGQRRYERPVGHGFREFAAMRGRIEQVAGVHAFRKHDQLGALPDGVLHILGGDGDVVVKVPKPGECLHRGGAKTALRHIGLQSCW